MTKDKEERKSMEIMGSSSSGDPDVKTTSSSGSPVGSSDGDRSSKAEQDPNREKPDKPDGNGGKEDIFADGNLGKDSVVRSDKSEITITPEDKAAFIDSVVSNTRFTKRYSLFGGRLTFTLRSLTADEVSALAAWAAKVGTTDSAGLVSGKYRKYLLAAHVAMLNGIEMPPLEEPLYERLGSDGKTVDPPGWINRCGYWDKVGFGQFQAILGCIGEFDARYSILCGKAEDANFWGPDTP